MNLYKLILIIVMTYGLYYAIALLGDILKSKTQTRLSTDSINTFYIPGKEAEGKPVRLNESTVGQFTQFGSLNHLDTVNGFETAQKNQTDNGYVAAQPEGTILQDLGIQVIDPGGFSIKDDNLLMTAKKRTPLC